MSRSKGVNTSEANFLSGRAGTLKLGGYGGTVHVKVVGNAIRVNFARGREDRAQLTFPGTGEGERESAVEAARRLLDGASGSGGPRSGRVAAEVTVGEVLSNLFRHACPRAPDEAYRTWGRGQIQRHLEAQPQHLRSSQFLSAAYIAKICQASRTLLADPRFRVGQAVGDLEFEDFEDFILDCVEGGVTSSTAGTHLNVLRSAIRRFKVTRRKRWGKTVDPTDAVWYLLKIEEIGRGEFPQERLRAVHVKAREMGLWRLEFAMDLISLTGRRIGEMGADQGGNYDYLGRYPLTAQDFDFKPDGSLALLLRAKPAKGEGYGRPDLILDIPRRLVPVMRQRLLEHANPAGPEHPILFSPQNPRKAISLKGLKDELDQAWEAAFPGEARPAFMSFHSMSKTAITEAMKHSPVETVADLCGKEPRTITDRYKKKGTAILTEVTAHLDRTLIRNDSVDSN